MKLTAQEEYGLRCLLQVARREGRGPVSIRAVAEAEGLSVEYTAKLLRVLRQGGLLHATRGAAGGYRLTRPASEITVWSAMRVLDAPLYGADFCGERGGQRRACVHDDATCSIRVLWQWLDASLRRALQRVTLADLAAGSTQAALMAPDAEPVEHAPCPE